MSEAPPLAAESAAQRGFAVRGPERMWASRLLIAVNVLVFVAMVLGGVSWLQPEPADIRRWGADFGPDVADGQWWRLLTCAFVHIGVIHIGFNMWAFRSLGSVVERLYGNGALILLYVSSALGASVASCLWNPLTLSAGASGAVFGVAGALVAFFMMHRQAMPPAVFKQLMKNMFSFIVLNVMFGLMVPGIDNAAHLGGLFTGFASGWCLNRDVREQPSLTPARVARLALVLLVVLVLAAMIPRRVQSQMRFVALGRPANCC